MLRIEWRHLIYSGLFCALALSGTFMLGLKWASPNIRVVSIEQRAAQTRDIPHFRETAAAQPARRRATKRPAPVVPIAVDTFGRLRRAVEVVCIKCCDPQPG